MLRHLLRLRGAGAGARFPRVRYAAGLACVALFSSPAVAQDTDSATLASMQAALERLQDQLDAQQDQLDQQQKVILQLTAALDDSGKASAASGQPATDDQPTTSGDDTTAVAAADANTDETTVVASTDTEAPKRSEGDRKAHAELAKRGKTAEAVNSRETLYDAANSAFDPNFRGAWHLPGTTAAMRIGGYVNAAVINSLDPLVARDRFIVGSIPPEGQDPADADDGTQLTANQSRINFEVREQTNYGQLRAFVEGDFLGDGDQFRLRHAYGQYQWILAGKTQTAFANDSAFPEGVDFEGVNGAILNRQTQLRLSPKVGEAQNLVVSLEDPRTDTDDGTGQPGFADVIVSVDKLPLGLGAVWDYKVAAIIRDLRAVEGDEDSGAPTKSTTGWGVTTSGRWSPKGLLEGDSILWQFTLGEGVGRYLNDLGVIGGGDAVFNPEGELEALPLFAGTLSYQHEWKNRIKLFQSWRGLLRSNLTLSWIDIDNFDYQDPLDYNRTLYASANLIYFPTQNARFGAELLWGERKNKDGSTGIARQFQISARYSF